MRERFPRLTNQLYFLTLAAIIILSSGQRILYDAI